jgi:hypothetical protein
MMTLSPRDRINYFKGILHLNIGKSDSQKLEEKELRNWIETLQFDSQFFEFAIRNLVNNEAVFEDPPVFSSKEVAKVFVRDGIRIAFKRKKFEAAEFEWLYQVLKKNLLEEQWFLKEVFYLIKPKD